MRIKRWPVIGIMAAGLLAAGVAVASSLSQSVSVGGDTFAAGQAVTIASDIGGDLYAAGAQVTTTGTTGGDVLAAGGALDLAGNVAGSIRAAGGQVTLDANVGRNVTVAGGSLQLTSGAHIHGNLVASGGSINLVGPVNGSAQLAGGSVELAGHINGDVNVVTGQLHLGAGTVIGGNLTYSSNQQAVIDAGAKVNGAITHKVLPAKTNDRSWTLILHLWSLITTLVMGLLLVWVFPAYVTRAAETLDRRPLRTLGIGLGMLLLGPPVLILLLVTIVGVPLALMGAAAYASALYLSRLVFMVWLGRRLGPWTRQKWGLPATFVLGLIVYWLLHLIPFVGWIMVLAGLVLGLGAGVQTLGRPSPLRPTKTKTR